MYVQARGEGAVADGGEDDGAEAIRCLVSILSSLSNISGAAPRHCRIWRKGFLGDKRGVVTELAEEGAELVEHGIVIGVELGGAVGLYEGDVGGWRGGEEVGVLVGWEGGHLECGWG